MREILWMQAPLNGKSDILDVYRAGVQSMGLNGKSGIRI